MNNEEAWKELFHKYDIEEAIKKDGFYRISASTIKEYREPRLMTKFDFKSQLPSVFAENGFSILPITRGDYIISNIETFSPLKDKTEIDIIERTVPDNIETLDFSAITSESIAINCAFATGILSDFSGQEKLLPTAEGRMKSDIFSFEINRSNGKLPALSVDVNNTQIEIDGGFEGEDCFVLIEAKNKICTDFMVRQLYYPYRKWEQKINKPVIPVFFEYSNGIFHLRQFKFTRLNDYNSLEVCKEGKYKLRDANNQITVQVVYDLLFSAKLLPEPIDVPFPQANSFERVINLCELLYNKEEEVYTKDILNYNMSFTGKPDFTRRQVDYYTNAAIYLGLVKKINDNNPTIFALTDWGQKILSTKSIIERQKMFIKTILSHQAFARVLRLYLDYGKPLSNEEIVQIMKDCNLYIGTDGVFARRGQTIKAWINWIIEMIDDMDTVYKYKQLVIPEFKKMVADDKGEQELE